jgi:hypothetical protein
MSIVVLDDRPGMPPVKRHFARNGDVLYEVELTLSDGRRCVFKWRQRWSPPEFVGAFEMPEPGGLGIQKPIPYGQRGAIKRERELARGATMRVALRHPWLRYSRQASPCEVHPYGVRCLSERHKLPLPAGFKKPKRARKAKNRR